MRIRTKLTLLFAGAATVLMLLAAIAGHYYLQRYLTERMEDNLNAAVAEHADDLNRNLLGKRNLLEISWYNLEKFAQDGKITENMLSGYKQVDPELTDMYFASVTGEFVDGSGWTPPPGYVPQERPWYKTAMQAGEITISEPYYDMVSNQLALAITMPVRDGQGNISGVISADFLLATLLEKLSWVNAYEGGYAYLMTQQGKILVFSDGKSLDAQAAYLLREEENEEFLQETQKNLQGHGTYQLQGMERLTFFRQIPALNGTLVMTVPQTVISQPLRQAAQVFILVAVLAIGSMIVLSVPIFRRISRPLENLLGQVKRVSAGDLQVSVEKSGYDELDELAWHFNQMVIDLQHSFAEIKRQNAENMDQMQSFQEATTHLITSGDSVDALFRVIAEDVNRIILGAHSTISTLSEDGTQWIVRHVAGHSSLQAGDSFSLEQGIIGETIQRCETVFVRCYKEYKRGLPQIQAEDVSSYIGFPLQIDGKTAGVLAVAWKDRIDTVDPRQEAILRQYANIAAVAIARAKDHEDMFSLAYRDTLTGLPNRYSFYQELQQLLQKKKGMAGYLFLFDLDNLKLVNDSLGHSQGDAFIRSVAESLQQIMAGSGICARLGGDEFAFWLCADGEKSPGEIAERLLQKIQTGETVSGHHLQITASMGIAVFPRDGETVEELMQNADAALYQAKYDGKNIWRMCNPELIAQSRDKLFLSNALRGAIAAGELRLVYQPIVDNKKNTVAFEALLRWQNAVYGAVSPAKFIPLAEQSGMMPVIGRWVLEEACGFAEELRQQGKEQIKIHVNVSVKQMENEDFSQMVEEIAGGRREAFRQVILEVTESVFMGSVDQAEKCLQSLKKAGFSIAMDDFGEGFSSLSQLLQLPVDSLKISRTLVRNLGRERQHLQYIKAIVEMMHALELEVVAEGVETDDEWNSTLDCGFDLIQGYFISVPLEKSAASLWAQKV